MELKPLKRKVCYYETDKMGVVHHSNYIRWFEEARVHFMEAENFPYRLVEEKGYMLPVLSSYAEYKIPLKFDDEFIIYSEIHNFSHTRFTVKYRVLNCNTGNLCAVGETSHCFVNMDFKPVRIKKECPEIYEFFSKFSLD